MAIGAPVYYHAILLKVIHNQFLINQTKPGRNGNVSCHQTERQNTGNHPTIDAQSVHQRQQRRNKHGNERDVDGDDILRCHCHAEQNNEQNIFFPSDKTRCRLRQRCGKPRVYHGGGKRTQQNITERHLGVIAHPLDEGIDNALDGNTGANPRRQSGDEQSEQDVSFPQTKNIQNDNGNHDRVRKQSHTRKIFRQERFLGKKKTCGQRKKERNAFELS